jgi:hypothetical protein
MGLYESTNEVNNNKFSTKGGRYIIYKYCISLLFVTLRQKSPVFFIPFGENRISKVIIYTMVSLIFGWWGIPWGPIFTIQSIINNMNGGEDVTLEIELKMTEEINKQYQQQEENENQKQLSKLINQTQKRFVPEGRIICPSCGLDVWNGYEKCWKCGAKLIK